MYSKFNLTIDSNFDKELEKYLESGNQLYDGHKKKARESLKKFIYTNGSIDGTAMKENWFQMENVDIFISHSHDDLDKVKAFAGWLYEEFGLKTFIDACVWGYCNELLKEIDNECCMHQDKATYDYGKRNYTTSHVHAMLSCALTEMIDKTECIMFYNTPRSIILEEELKEIPSSDVSKTASAWIYYELAMTSFVKTEEPKRFKQGQSIFESFAHKDSAQRGGEIQHEVEKYLKEMITITSTDLKKWCAQNEEFKGLKFKPHSLDILYTQMCISNGSKATIL